jgi:hypothetical protein
MTFSNVAANARAAASATKTEEEPCMATLTNMLKGD